MVFGYGPLKIRPEPNFCSMPLVTLKTPPLSFGNILTPKKVSGLRSNSACRVSLMASRSFHLSPLRAWPARSYPRLGFNKSRHCCRIGVSGFLRTLT